MNNTVTGTEKLDDVDDDDNDDDNCGVSLVVQNVSMSSLCGASSGCDGGDGHQRLSAACNVLNKQKRNPERGVFQLGRWTSCQQRNNVTA